MSAPFTDFNRDAAAEVGVMFDDFIRAVGIYVQTNENAREVTIADVAMAFNTTPELAREAIEAHPWLVTFAYREDPMGEDPIKVVVVSDGE